MLLWPFPSFQSCFLPHSQRACVCLCKTVPINKLSFLIYFIYCQSALECLDLHCHCPHCRVCVMARCLSVRPSVCSACITTPSMVRRDICRHSYPVERGLVVSLCGQSVVTDPTIQQQSFDLPPHTWSPMNHFRTGQGPCHANLHKWGLAQSPSCDCGQRQTMNHTVDTCPLTKFECGLNLIHNVDDGAVMRLNPQRLQHSRNNIICPLHFAAAGCPAAGRYQSVAVLCNLPS